MKNVLSYLVLVLVLINCQEPKENPIENKFSKNVGQKIPNEVAARWAENYKKNNPSSRTNNLSLSINTLQSLLEPAEDKLGASFHHAIDDYGHQHILITPVIEDTPTLISTVVDVNNGPINISTAQDWMSRYKDENQQGPWFNFFGIYVLEHIAGLADVAQIELVDGIDDFGGRQLLLYVWFTQEYAGKSQHEELAVYDKSVVCPPDCGNSANAD